MAILYLGMLQFKINHLQKSLLLISLVSLFALSACKKNRLPPSLPEITQEGKDTFGCLVDGKVFTQKLRFNSHLHLGATYAEYSPYYFTVSAPRIGNNTLETIGFNSSGVVIKEGSTYKLGGYGVQGEICATYHSWKDLVSSSYRSKNDLQGEITISKLSPTVIAGTFSFDAINENGAKVEVREGRFDLKRF